MIDSTVLVHEALANFAPIKTDPKAWDIALLNVIASLAFSIQDSSINLQAVEIAGKISDLIGQHPEFENLDEFK